MTLRLERILRMRLSCHASLAHSFTPRQDWFIGLEIHINFDTQLATLSADPLQQCEPIVTPLMPHRLAAAMTLATICFHRCNITQTKAPRGYEVIAVRVSASQHQKEFTDSFTTRSSETLHKH
jgi:hypothetical protein